MSKMYFCMMEESSEDGLIRRTPKQADMSYIKKLIQPILKPLQDKIKQLAEESLNDLRSENETLKKEVDRLSKELSKEQDENREYRKKTDLLMDDRNRQKASSVSKYKGAINSLCQLNRKINYNVTLFASRENKLNIIQMLVNYLYKPTKSLRDTITSTAAEHREEILSILKDIEDFNEKNRQYLLDYLDEIHERWEDCVLFPNEIKFNHSTMTPYKDEIEDGTPIYVVSLGFKFPNSNLDETLPQVIPKGH